MDIKEIFTIIGIAVILVFPIAGLFTLVLYDEFKNIKNKY